MTYDLTDEVKAIGSLNIEGNITPVEWFNHIKLPNNKPDLVSIILLSDIVYWYRPTTIRDELSGKVIGYRKKFKSDLLQKGYKDIEAFFGLSKDQIKKSLQRLEQLNLIKRVFRNITCNGSSLANVMFIQIFPTNIINITERTPGMDVDTQTAEHIYPGVRVNKPTPPSINHHTYTETTTKISTNNSLSKKIKDISSNTLSSLGVSKENEREKEMLNIWNEVVEEKNEVTIKLTAKREKLLNSTLKEFFNEDLSTWKDFCKKIASSKFLMGEITNFKAQVDWVLKEENLIKIMENSYGVGDRPNENQTVITDNIEQKLIEEIENSNTPKFWQQILLTLMKEKGISTYISWFRKNQYVGFKDGVLEIKSFSKFGAEYIRNNFADKIENICKDTIDSFEELKIAY